jgi:hypothetical protein
MESDGERARRAEPVKEKRVMAYRQLMRAAERISKARHEQGVSWTTIEEALASSELTAAEVPVEPDLFLTTLTRFVAELGGRVEVRAVFPEETITVRRDPTGERG